MTPAAFRKLALSLEGATEGAHGGHADFRAPAAGLRVAGLSRCEFGAWSSFAPEQQQMVTQPSRRCSFRSKGAWGQRRDQRQLAAVDSRAMLSALTMVWQNVMMAGGRISRCQRSRYMTVRRHGGMAMTILDHDLQTNCSHPIDRAAGRRSRDERRMVRSTGTSR